MNTDWKLGVFLALGNGDDLAARADAGLHEGEAAQPGHVDLLVHQGLHRGRVVADRCEFDLHAQLLLQVGGDGAELAHLLGGGLFGDGGHAKHLLGMGQAGQGEQGAGQESTARRRKARSS
jgi:hypothetical protein